LLVNWSNEMNPNRLRQRAVLEICPKIATIEILPSAISDSYSGYTVESRSTT